jgi:hypothetical protein
MSKKCENCVGEFLKGATCCRFCQQELEFSKVNQGGPARKIGKVKSLAELETQSEYSDGDDMTELQDMLFNWKNPTAVNVAGGLICLSILIATFI